MRGQSIFITGGTGFVGSWLLESLLWANDQLHLGITVAVLTRDPARFRECMPHLADHPGVQVVGGNAVNFEFPKGQFPFVIHASVEAAFEPDLEHPLGAFDSDVKGTQRVLEFARTHSVKRFLFTSSGAVYGTQPTELTHVSESFTGAPLTTDTRSGYGQAKRVSEFMVSMHGQTFGFDTQIARLFAFVGPRLPLDANYAVGNFIGDALRGASIKIGGDGTPYRSYLYAADMAVWLWTILLRGKSAHPYNVGSQHDLTIAELAQAVVSEIAPNTHVEIATKATVGVLPSRYVPDTTRAEAELGLRSLILVAEGIKRTAHWRRINDSCSSRPSTRLSAW